MCRDSEPLHSHNTCSFSHPEESLNHSVTFLETNNFARRGPRQTHHDLHDDVSGMKTVVGIGPGKDQPIIPPQTSEAE